MSEQSQIQAKEQPMSVIDTLTDKDLKKEFNLQKEISKYVGGKRFLGVIVVTLIFIFGIPKDQFTWGIYMTFMTAWSGLETVRKGGIEKDGFGH